MSLRRLRRHGRRSRTVTPATAMPSEVDFITLGCFPSAAHHGRAARPRILHHASRPHMGRTWILFGPLAVQFRSREPAIAASRAAGRSEEHTTELTSLMRSSYDVFSLKKQILIEYNSKSTLHHVSVRTQCRL